MWDTRVQQIADSVGGAESVTFIVIWLVFVADVTRTLIG